LQRGHGRNHEKYWFSEELLLEKCLTERTLEEERSKCFERMKHIIAHSVTVAYPKDGYEVCLFTDASDFHWDVIVTQMAVEDLDLDVLVQRHEPLAFLS
jgi:hypothetical protein